MCSLKAYSLGPTLFLILSRVTPSYQGLYHLVSNIYRKTSCISQVWSQNVKDIKFWILKFNRCLIITSTTTTSATAATIPLLSLPLLLALLLLIQPLLPLLLPLPPALLLLLQLILLLQLLVLLQLLLGKPSNY